MAQTMISMILETVLPICTKSLGRTPIDSGTYLLPAIVMAIMSVISGWLYETFGAKC